VPEDEHNPTPDQTGAESWSLLNLFLNSKQGIVVLLLGAAAFGAIHALTPGHGKTLVAAYLVGERGTAWHAILLGIVTTVTHTAAVILIAIALLFFPQTNLATLHIVLEFAGGLLVLSLGLWLLYTRLTGRADHVHLGTGHHHHHHHGDGHHHDHHHHDAVSPETAGEKPSTWALVLLGFKGGMVPCWDAIAMLTIAISAGRLWLALPLLLAFSAGLAGVLTGLGIAVVHARKFAGNRLQGGDRFQRIFRTLPLVSATAITLVGLWLCYDGLHPR
jgi:nickel/cobalt exporter